MATVQDMILRLAGKAASVRYGTATDGDNTSLTDSLLSEMGQNAGGVIFFLSGDAIGLSRVITGNPKDKFVFAALPSGTAAPVTAISYLLKVVTITAVNTLEVGDHIRVAGINTGFTLTNVDGDWICETGTNATTIKFTVTSQPVGTSPQTITVGTVTKLTVPFSGDRYAYVDKEAPRDILFAALNAGLRQVNPRLAEDITTLVDPEVDKYTLPTGVRNIIKVEIANSLTAPLYYTEHRHWREVEGELRFDYGYAPAYEDAIIRLTWREQHTDLTDDDDEIPIEVDQEALFWRSMIELMSMLMSLRPKKQRYLDFFQEAQTEWQRRVVPQPQRPNHLAGW